MYCPGRQFRILEKTDAGEIRGSGRNGSSRWSDMRQKSDTLCHSIQTCCETSEDAQDVDKPAVQERRKTAGNYRHENVDVDNVGISKRDHKRRDD